MRSPIKILLTVFAVALLTATAAINPRSLSVDVQSTLKVQNKDVQVKRSGGQHDTSNEKVTVLTIKHRCMGLPAPVKVEIEAKFIARNPASGKLSLQSQTRTPATVGSNLATTELSSDPMEQSVKHTTDGFTKVKTTSGLQPYGWIVTVFEGGSVVAVRESAAGLAVKFKEALP